MSDIQWWIRFHTAIRDNAIRSREYALAIGNRDKVHEQTDRILFHERAIAKLEARLNPVVYTNPGRQYSSRNTG